MKKQEKNHGHGSIKIHGVQGRVYFKFWEREDGKFDWTIADNKGFSLGVETKVLDSIQAVAQEIGVIGRAAAT